MKRGTLLLALALLLQGLATWDALGANPTGLSNKERRAAKKARKKAPAAAEAADGQTAFQITFGPQPKPADYASDDASSQEDGKAEADLATSARAAAAAAVNKAIKTADAQPATANDNSTPEGEKVTGWLDTIFGPTAAEPTPQKLHQKKLAGALNQIAQKANGLRAIKDARAAHQATLSAHQIKAAAKKMQRGRTAIPHEEVFHEQEDRGMIRVLQELRRIAAQKADKNKSFRDPYTPAPVEYDSEYSDVEGGETEEYIATQGKYRSLNPLYDLRNPATLLTHLQKEVIAPEHQQHFENLLAAAISTLVEQAEQAISAAREGDINTRRECVKTNEALMQMLNEIARAARLKELNLTKASKNMVFVFQQMSDHFVSATAEMARTEIAGARVILNDDDFRLPTAARIIARAKRTKHGRLQGADGTDNLAVLTRAIATLTRGLKDGNADLETVASVLDLLNSPKGVHVAPHVVKELHEALAQVATENNETSQRDLTEAVALDARLTALSGQVAAYAQRFTDDDITSAEADTAFLEDLTDFLPADDKGDGWSYSTE